MNQPLTPQAIDLLLDEVLAELANPLTPAGLAARLQTQSLTRSPAMQTSTMPAPILRFRTLDRATETSSRKTVVTAALLHLAALLLVGYATVRVVSTQPAPAATVSLTAPVLPPPAPPKALLMGGGGGQKSSVPVSQGNIPPAAELQVNPPKTPPAIAPKIEIPVTVDAQKDLKMAKVDTPNLGMPSSLLVGSSPGNGNGTGIGGGSGAGVGFGIGGNTGGGIKRVGGGVSAPVVIFEPQPEFSEEARKAKVAGNVLVAMVVGADGKPSQIHVLRGIGLGLDEKAVEAAARYRFKPAQEDGKAVSVRINLEVTFTIY